MAYQLGPVDPQERSDFRAEEAEGAGHPAGRRALSSALVVAVMAVFAGGLWLAYVEGGRQAGGAPGAVPLIRADPSPMKRKPAEPGGMKVPDRNMLIFGERHPSVEHLLPPPEQPLPRPAPPPPPQPAAMPAAAPPAAPQAGSPSPAAAAEGASGQARSPHVAETPTETRPAPGEPAPAKGAERRPPRHSGHGAAAPSDAKPTKREPAPAAKRALAPAKAAQARAEHAAAEPREHKPAPAAPPAREEAAARPPAAAGHDARLQLGAVRSPAAAREEWQRLRRANPALLGNVTAYAVRADLGAKGVFYRIETAPFADAAAADRLCEALKRRNFRCFIAR